MIRQVSFRLNTVLTKSQVFLRAAKFVFPDEWKPEFPVFKKSTILWQNLEFRTQAKSMTGSSVWNPKKKRKKKGTRTHSVTRIDIKNVTVRWNTLHNFLIQFSGLKSLGLFNCILKFGDRDGWFQTPEQVTKFIDLQNRLEKLTIIVDDVVDANFCLNKFTGKKLEF